METAIVYAFPLNQAVIDRPAGLDVAPPARIDAERYNMGIRQVPEQTLPASATTLGELTSANRKVVSARLLVVDWVLQQGVSENKAVSLLLAEASARVVSGTTGQWLPERVVLALKSASKKNQLLPSATTIKSWLTDYRRAGGNPVALADNHTGRRRLPQPWDLRALQMFHIPSKPSFADVADWLTMEGFTATAPQVRRFIQSLPSDYREHSKWRMGKHFHKLNLGRHKTRDRSSLHVGEMYEGDGHTIDVYLQHPSGSPRPYRLEITAWMDIRSRRIVSIGISDAESALSTLESLSRAILLHDHVPTFVHIDKGSGFIAKMMNDKSVGYYEKMGITTCEAIAGNAKGKGDIEGWFGWLRNKCDKQFGIDYTGHDQSPDSNRRITDQVARGERTLPSVEEYVAKLLEVADFYNNRPQRGLGGISPNQTWDDEIDAHQNPVILKDDAAVRVSTTRAIRRGRINLDNRVYESPLLMPYSNERDRYEIEYSTADDSLIWVYDKNGRLVCEAPLITKMAWLPASRREEARIKSQQAKQKRREKQIALDRLEATRHIDHTHQLEALEDMGADAWEEIDEPRSGISIDLTDDDF